MRSPAVVQKHHSCCISPSCISCPPSPPHSPPAPEGSLQRSEKGAEWIQSLLGKKWFSVKWMTWMTQDEYSRMYRKLVYSSGGRRDESLSWVYESFPLKSANSLNSNQAQDAWISIWVVHQRAKGKEIWAGAGSGPKAFKWFLSVRKLFPLSVHVQENCLFRTWFALHSGQVLLTSFKKKS